MKTHEEKLKCILLNDNATYCMIPMIRLSGKSTATDIGKRSVVPWVGGKDKDRKKNTENFKGSETILYAILIVDP